MAYKPKAEDRPWIIEQRQEYCLDDKWLPYPIDKPDMSKQLICGLKHHHDFKKMHRDIKPANIMLELVEYRANGLDRSRWVAKYTDHEMVASTDRMVKQKCGSLWIPSLTTRKPTSSLSASCFCVCGQSTTPAARDPTGRRHRLPMYSDG